MIDDRRFFKLSRTAEEVSAMRHHMDRRYVSRYLYREEPPVDPNLNDVLITVTGDQGVGKSAVLRVIINALADAGLLTMADTKSATEAPNQFFGYALIENEKHSESIDIAICRDAAVEYHLGRPE